jgi:hypothetical protein
MYDVVVFMICIHTGAHPSGEIGEHPHGPPNNLMPYVSQVSASTFMYVPYITDVPIAYTSVCIKPNTACCHSSSSATALIVRYGSIVVAEQYCMLNHT